jgi:hypothetical protein
MLKLACQILGEDFNQLNKMSVDARQKIRTLFGLVLIPALLYFFAGYGLTKVVFEGSWWQGILTGLIMGLIVLKLDIGFMQAGGGWGVGVYRFFIVMLGCALNSLILDSLIFHEDYKHISRRIQEQNANQNWALTSKGDSILLAKWSTQLDSLHAEMKTDKNDCKKEMKGESPTGQIGVGPISNKLEKWHEEGKQSADSLKFKVDTLEIGLLNRQNKFISSKMSAAPGFLTNTKAMFELTATEGNGIMLAIWLVIFSFIGLIEFSPLFVKKNTQPTDYDRWKEFSRWQKEQQIAMEQQRLERLQQRLSNLTSKDHQVLAAMKAKAELN